MKNCGGISFFRSVSKIEDQNKSHLTFNYQIQETHRVMASKTGLPEMGPKNLNRLLSKNNRNIWDSFWEKGPNTSRFQTF